MKIQFLVLIVSLMSGFGVEAKQGKGRGESVLSCKTKTGEVMVACDGDIRCFMTATNNSHFVPTCEEPNLTITNVTSENHCEQAGLAADLPAECEEGCSGEAELVTHGGTGSACCTAYYVRECSPSGS